MHTKSRFDWEEMFDGFTVDVEFEHPSFAFRKEAESGDFDGFTDNYYNLLLEHTELLGSFFGNKSNVFGCTFFSNVVIYLLGHNVDIDNIALILRRIVNVLFTCFGGVFLLDGVLTTLCADKEEAVGSSLSWRPVIRESGEYRVGGIPLFETSKCVDLSNFMRFAAVQFYMQHNGKISLSEIVDDITAFVREKFFVSLFSRLCLSAYIDKDWDAFETQVDEENRRKGLYDFDNRCELKKGLPSALNLVHVGDECSPGDDVEQTGTLSIKFIGCYAFSMDADKFHTGFHAGNEVNFYPDRWCPDGVDWLNNGYINGVSVLDILESGIVGPKGLVSDDGSFSIDDPQDFRRGWCQRCLCLRVYGDVTVEYRYPESEEANESDESDE